MDTKQSLLEQALKLPAEDREALAEELFASLDGEDMSPEIEAAWLAEARRRLEDARRDPSKLLDGEQVFAELRREFGA